MISRQDGRKDPTIFLHLDRAGRRHAIIVMVARLLVVVAAILMFYFFVPVSGFNADNPAGAWVRLIAVSLVFLTAMIFQVQIVTAAKVPRVRAAEAVVESVLLFLCLFSLLYASMSASDPSSFNEPMTKISSLYFTTTTFATVGFGDITPTSELARSVVTVQMIAGLGALVLVAKIIFFAASQSLRPHK